MLEENANHLDQREEEDQRLYYGKLYQTGYVFNAQNKLLEINGNLE